jgi:hypothetical protein
MSSSCWMDDELLIVRLLNGVLSFHVICCCKLVLVCPEGMGVFFRTRSRHPCALFGRSRRPKVLKKTPIPSLHVGTVSWPEN